MSRLFKDNEDKACLLIKLAYNISLEELEKEYGITKKQIINIRKNNYKLYNTFVDHFTILDEVASLCIFTPIQEYAINICKRAYLDKFIIINKCNFIFKGESIGINEVIDLANKILARDDLPPLSETRIKINQYYIQRNNKCRKRKQK